MVREDWSDDILAPLERFDYTVAHEPVPRWIRERHKPTSGPYHAHGTLATIIGSYFAGTAETYKGTPDRVLEWLHQDRDLDAHQIEFLTDLLESIHPVELGSLLATSSLTLYELVQTLHRCGLTTGWLARWLNEIAIPNVPSTFLERDVTSTAWAWTGRQISDLVHAHGGSLWIRGASALTSTWRHRPTDRLELGIDRKTWDDRIGTGRALPIHDPGDETGKTAVLTLCQSLNPPPERMVYSKHDEWWRWDAPWGAVYLYRGEDGEPDTDSTDLQTGLARESATAAVTRIIEEHGTILDATHCIDLAEGMDRAPDPFDRNRRWPAWCATPVMYLRARALHAVWNDAPAHHAPRIAKAASRVAEWTLDALGQDEQHDHKQARARWKRA